MSFPRVLLTALVGGLLACSSHPAASVAHDAGAEGATVDGGEEDASNAGDATDASDDVNKAAPCLEDANAFGSALTNSFGRVDGTIVAVIPPDDQACADPNSTHLIVEVLMQGAVYRMVVDVLSDEVSDSGSYDVFFYEMDAPLADGAWSDGWHTGIDFDYVSTLAIHSTPFVAMSQADVVAKITSELTLGAHVSFFATSDDEPDSAHLVHRNTTNQDGAIVVSPETAPHYLLIRFSEDSF
ncbi:MAG: hypothetical protein ACLQVI_13255 [Polyangiaceae bacterium]